MKQYVVEKEKIKRNIKTVVERAGGAKIYAVVKSDGYGIGCFELAKICSECGMRDFAVNTAEEAAAIIDGNIGFDSILKFFPADGAEEIKALSPAGVIFTVSSESDAELLNEYGKESGNKPKAHIKIDTGMGRRGFFPSETDRIAALYEKYKFVDFSGIYTHFSDAYDKKSANRQFNEFIGVIDALEKRGINVGEKHICNSVALFHCNGMNLDAVRVGSALFGRIAGGAKFGLERTGEYRVTPENIRVAPCDLHVGYGQFCKVRRGTRLATFRLGTGDGFGQHGYIGARGLRGTLVTLRRNLARSRGLNLKFNGRACPVVGFVGPGHCVVDVTAVDCSVNDVFVADANPIGVPKKNVAII